MTVDDIRNAVFDKTLGRGYRMDQVDDFLAQVAAEFGRKEREKEDIEKKLYILAEKVDQYRNDEETLKTALLNAQRMGESVIYEARQKAETIVYDANNKASRLREEARQVVADAEEELRNLKAEVTHFKKNILDMYRQHIELLSVLPEERHIEAEPDEPEKPQVVEEEKAAPSEQPEQEEAQDAAQEGAAFDLEDDAADEDEAYEEEEFALDEEEASDEAYEGEEYEQEDELRLMLSTMSRRMMRHISTKIILSFKSRRLKYSKSPKSRCRSQSPKENRPHARHVLRKMFPMERMRTSRFIDANSGVSCVRRCFSLNGLLCA